MGHKTMHSLHQTPQLPKLQEGKLNSSYIDGKDVLYATENYIKGKLLLFFLESR